MKSQCRSLQAYGTSPRVPIEGIPFRHIGCREVHAREALGQRLSERHLKQTWAQFGLNFNHIHVSHAFSIAHCRGARGVLMQGDDGADKDDPEAYQATIWHLFWPMLGHFSSKNSLSIAKSGVKQLRGPQIGMFRPRFTAATIHNPW